MNKIYLLYENPEWIAPLKDALAHSGYDSVEWDMHNFGIDLSKTPPQGVFLSRMSASAHTRNHRFAPEYSACVLAWLERHGRRVINGSTALDLELNKTRQYMALEQAGVRLPKTHVAIGAGSALKAATLFKQPFVVKHNRGGKGIGVTRYDSARELSDAIETDSFDAGPDGVVLVQQYIEAPEPYIIRNEFVGGRHLYSVRVDTRDGFELCPADVCTIDDSVNSDPVHRFEILPDFEHADLPRYERVLAQYNIDVAGVEMIFDKAGNAYAYDINVNTNYNSDAEQRAGVAGTERSGMMAVAKLIVHELGKLEQSLSSTMPDQQTGTAA